MDEPIRIAIIEDSDEDARTLKNGILRYGEENHVLFSFSTFSTADYFLFADKGDFDCLFFDVELPGTDGIQAAKEIRKKDSKVDIVFCTSFSQFAIAGYEVHAKDYLVKPYTYAALSMTLNQIVKSVRQKKDQYLEITTKSGKMKINTGSILYLESVSHHVYFETLDGEKECYSSLSGILERLPQETFCPISSAQAVNLNHISKIIDDTLYIGNQKLVISKRMKSTFLRKLNQFMNGGNN